MAALKKSLTIKEEHFTQLQKQADDKRDQMALGQLEAKQQQARACELKEQVTATKAEIEQRKKGREVGVGDC